MKKSWILFFVIRHQAIYFDLENLAILFKEFCPEGKSYPSPASILHCSHLLIMWRDFQRPWKTYPWYLLDNISAELRPSSHHTYTMAPPCIDSCMSEMSVRKKTWKEDIPGFHVATLPMSNSSSLEPPHDPLHHLHPAIPSSTFCLLQESRQPLKPKWYMMLD